MQRTPASPAFLIGLDTPAKRLARINILSSPMRSCKTWSLPDSVHVFVGCEGGLCTEYSVLYAEMPPPTIPSLLLTLLRTPHRASILPGKYQQCRRKSLISRPWRMNNCRFVRNYGLDIYTAVVLQRA